MNEVPLHLPVETSHAVNRELFKKADEIRQRLERFGLDTSSKYSLAPPLGGRLVTPPPPRPSTQAQFHFLGSLSQGRREVEGNPAAE